MPDSCVPASTFPPAARAALRPLRPLFSPTHFHEEPKNISHIRFVIAVSDYLGQYGRSQGSQLPGLQRARRACRADGTADGGSPCPPSTVLDQDATGSNRPHIRSTAPATTFEEMATSFQTQARPTIHRERRCLRARHPRCSGVRVAAGSRCEVRLRRRPYSTISFLRLSTNPRTSNFSRAATLKWSSVAFTWPRKTCQSPTSIPSPRCDIF